MLLRQFTDRSRVLQAHSALTALEAVIRAGGCTDVEYLRVRADQIVTGAHAFEEVRVLDQLRTGGLQLREEHAAELDRLLGGSGHDPATRLGLAERRRRRRDPRRRTAAAGPLAAAGGTPAVVQGGTDGRPRRQPDARRHSGRPAADADLKGSPD